ncbi:uncharacterized protein LOC113287649 isoform X2 [Papaver somniferum]|uniref:uncharacterized protein LOC113287649 isoform X2 n=1 Tax=Papaver somniferum TaxID=3469 RepID=UPI000E6FE115|nr:uncharacterized protein LOC113287649 isoform X2 [Papaver somniferum]
MDGIGFISISIQLSYTGRIDKRGKQEPLGRKTRVSVWEPKLDILAQKPYNFAYFGSLPPNNHNGSRINEQILNDDVACVLHNHRGIFVQLEAIE